MPIPVPIPCPFHSRFHSHFPEPVNRRLAVIRSCSRVKCAAVQIQGACTHQHICTQQSPTDTMVYGTYIVCITTTSSSAIAHLNHRNHKNHCTTSLDMFGRIATIKMRSAIRDGLRS